MKRLQAFTCRDTQGEVVKALDPGPCSSRAKDGVWPEVLSTFERDGPAAERAGRARAKGLRFRRKRVNNISPDRSDRSDLCCKLWCLVMRIVLTLPEHAVSSVVSVAAEIHRHVHASHLAQRSACQKTCAQQELDQKGMCTSTMI